MALGDSMVRHLVLTLTALSCLSACGSSDDSDGDTSPDTAPDGGSDATSDLGSDTREDAAPDASEDVVPDVSEDVVPDVSEDVVPDVSEDANGDADAEDTSDAADTADTRDADDASDTADVGGGRPVISPIDDQTSERNTVTPALVEVSFTVSDPDFAVGELVRDVSVTNPALWSPEDSSVECTAGECVATLALLPEACRPQTVTIEATNPAGGSATEEFTISPIASVLVTTTANDGEGSLRDALAAAGDGDVIGFDQELFPAGGIIALEGGLSLRNDAELTIDGCDVGPVISGEDTHRVFGSHTGIDYLRRITVTAARNQSGGGVIGVGIAGSLTVSECTFRDNTTQRGSGSSTCGGAILVEGRLHVERSLFVGNQAIVESGRATGGAICAIEGEGGASPATVRIVNSTFFGNSTSTTTTGDGFGGAIALSGTGDVTISHSTIVGNSAVTSGGGLYVPSGTPLALSHTLVAGNTSPEGSDLFGVFAGSNFNLIGDAAGSTGIDTAASDITFLSLGGAAVEEVVSDALAMSGGPTGTLALVGDGPAVDAGNEEIEDAPSTDQRGSRFERIVRARIDIGAFELGDE